MHNIDTTLLNEKRDYLRLYRDRDGQSREREYRLCDDDIVADILSAYDKIVSLEEIEGEIVAVVIHRGECVTIRFY